MVADFNINRVVAFLPQLRGVGSPLGWFGILIESRLQHGVTRSPCLVKRAVNSLINRATVQKTERPLDSLCDGVEPWSDCESELVDRLTVAEMVIEVSVKRAHCVVGLDLDGHVLARFTIELVVGTVIVIGDQFDIGKSGVGRTESVAVLNLGQVEEVQGA